MSNRDDFRKKTKEAVASRAGWHCSLTGCGKSTVGPSEESAEAFTNIGKAAHISAASPGGRRYDPTMTCDQRISIDNAIWLCSDHADLIDRDEVTYTIKALQEMKRVHEVLQTTAVRTGKNNTLGAGLLGIGPEVICMGDIESVSASNWTLHIKHFVLGDVHKLVAFINGFANFAAQDKYIISNEAGDGRLLSAAPTLTKREVGFTMLCPVEARFPRVDVHKLGSTMAEDPVTHDIFVTEGHIARVAGLAALPQVIRSALSMQRGENVFTPDAGMRFFEYFDEFRGTPWLDWIMTLDVVRQAAIPYSGGGLNTPHTPLPCISRVVRFELLSDTPVNNRVPVRVNLEIQGLGPWEHELSIYMPTREQMEERAVLLAQRAFS